MTVHHFEAVRARRTKRGRCPMCGRSVLRSRTFEQTISPFNRHPGGEPRTRAEIRAAVEAEADAWQPDFTHAGCEAP